MKLPLVLQLGSYEVTKSDDNNLMLIMVISS